MSGHSTGDDHDDPWDFPMPTTAEIEEELALGNPGWKNLLRSSETVPQNTDLIRAAPRASWVGRTLILVALATFAVTMAGVAAAIDGPGHMTTPVASKNACRHFLWTARGPLRIDQLVCLR